MATTRMLLSLAVAKKWVPTLSSTAALSSLRCNPHIRNKCLALLPLTILSPTFQSSKDGKRTQVWSTTHFGNDHSKQIKPSVDQLDKFIKDHVRLEVANHGAEL
jgi:hypothetical protein